MLSMQQQWSEHINAGNQSLHLMCELQNFTHKFDNAVQLKHL